jgi:hypothetical protein
MRVIFRNKFVRWVLTPLVVLFGLGWGYYQINYPTCTFRYKLTAEVNTPDGLKTGSSVIEVRYSHNGDYGGGESPDLNLNGEAVYVDLGAGKNLFVTLTTWGSARAVENGRRGRNFEGDLGPMNPFGLLLKVFGLTWKFGEERQLCRELSKLSLNTSKAASFENLPSLVTFGNISDPNSIAIVDPSNFYKSYGSGYFLKRVTITPSAEMLTKTIDQILVWLPAKKEEWLKHQDRAFMEGPLINQIYYDGFKAPGIWGDGGSGL